jgi:YegS/Rv2252/BmrU family lipid kinase
VPSRTLVIANPASGAGRTERALPRLEDALRAAIGGYELVWTRGVRDAERLAREAVRAGVDRLVVAGGDGTAAEVVSGLMGAALGAYAEIAFLPLGTGADFHRTLDIPRDPEAAIARLATGKGRRIDVGRVRFAEANGAERTSHFLNVASAGLSGVVTRHVRGSKALGARLAFLLGTLGGLVSFRPSALRLAVDGSEVYRGPVALVAAANGRYFGGGMHVAPEARPDDGLLDVVLVPALPKRVLVTRLPRLYRGTHLAVPGVALFRGRHVELEPIGPPAPGEIDGEPVAQLPMAVDVLPGALQVWGAGA